MNYKITEELDCNLRPFFYVKVRGLFKWHIVKEFRDEDVEYARRCAEDLLDTLNASI